MFNSYKDTLNKGSLSAYFCLMYFPSFTQFGVDEFLLVIFLISLIGINIHYVISVLPVVRLKKNYLEESETNEPVSVIICARNEEDYLTEYLPKFLTQNYPDFEVIVVNDCSIDNTEHVIDEFAKIFPNLKKVNIKEDDYYKHGKKMAVMVGIKGAKHEHLLFTDADCYPINDLWLRDMSRGFVNKREIVLGYGAYQKEKGFLNTIIRFDTFLIAVQYLSAAINGEAYMGVGRNLAYKKSLFYSQKGFAKHYHIESGDDDLFINQAGNKENTNICITENAITYSIPKKTFSLWKKQKLRHLTTAPHYKSSSIVKLQISYAAQYFFYISLASLFFHKTTIISAFIGLFVKIIAQIILFNKAAKKLQEPDLWSMSFFYEFILLIIYPIFYISKLFYRPNKWKN